MFRAGYIIFAIALALFIAAVAWLTQPEHGDPTKFTTSKRCQTCHETESSGEIYKTWFASKHSQAYSSLFGEVARNYLKNVELTEQQFLKLSMKKDSLKKDYKPEEWEHNSINNDSVKLDLLRCYSCHTALGYKPQNLYEDSIAQEGVSCEACHGAGSRYSTFEVMQNRNEFVKRGGVVATLQDCYLCHAKTLDSNRVVEFAHCPLQKKDFNAEEAWKSISHKAKGNRRELIIERKEDSLKKVSNEQSSTKKID